MSEIDPEIVALFREESFERLGQLTTLIDQLRTGTELAPVVDEINRELHTIKGSVKMLGFPRFGTFVHELEALTPMLGDDEGALRGDVLDLFEEAADEVATLVEEVCRDFHDRSPEELLTAIRVVVAGGEPPSKSKGPRLRAPSRRFPKPVSQRLPRAALVKDRPFPSSVFPENVGTLGSESPSLNREIFWSSDTASASPGADPRGAIDPRESGNFFVAQLRQGGALDKLRKSRSSSKRRVPLVDELVRVRSSKLATLDGLVSDLIDSRLRLDDHEAKLRAVLKEAVKDSFLAQQVKPLYQRFREDRRHLDPLVKGFEQLAIDLRLRPLARVFDQSSRIARDLARKEGKRVRIQISGETTELDRVILDSIKDPLAHIMRNVVDHGIELPAQRVEAGKREKGSIELSAFQEGISVVIRIADDGAGVDTERLKAKVSEAQLLTSDQVSRMNHHELVELVFLPGLSTRSEVSEISGRGIGMDVVRRNVEALKGEVHIESVRGEGTTIELRLPLTLLVSRVLLVGVGESEFALPTESLDRTAHVSSESLSSHGGMKVFRSDGRSIPVVSLALLLGMETEEQVEESRSLDLVIVRHKADYLALDVSELIGERSVVIKPLGWPLRGVPGIGGAIVLGSGSVALVLHIPEVIELFRSHAPSMRIRDDRLVSDAPRRHVLVVDDSKVYRGLAGSALEALGYQVTFALDGEDGWKQCLLVKPDLVLSDVEMPRLNGFQLTKRIREDPRTSHLPVIVVSTLSSADAKERGFEAGANGYLVKSEWSDKALGDEIRRFLG